MVPIIRIPLSICSVPTFLTLCLKFSYLYTTLPALSLILVRISALYLLCSNFHTLPFTSDLNYHFAYAFP
jgi:hypothetical protein